MNSRIARRLLPLAFCCAPLTSQLPAQLPTAGAFDAVLDVKPDPVPDPVKGWPDPSPLTDAERARMRRPDRPPHAEGPVVDRVLAEERAPAFDRVLVDRPGDGRIWVRGGDYKASFGQDGFVYIPFLGSDAPRNFPVQFTVRAIRVGGHDVAFDRKAVPTCDGTRVVFDRGALRETYDLSLAAVEQTFTVDAGEGDVDVELDVTSELAQQHVPGEIRFGNAHGGVRYGDAFLVVGAEKRRIATSCEGKRLRMRVPAARRGSGAVVIDPIISNSATGWPMTLQTPIKREPDISYDASTDRYMLVHTHVFSADDNDTYAEMRDGTGAFVPNSLTIIDQTIASHSFPRVANLNSNNRFLVVTERYDGTLPAGSRYRIYGRTQNAAAPYSQSAQFHVSTSFTGDKYTPDVGGDSGSGTRWTVVYVREAAPTDWDIHGQQVSSTGAPVGNVILLENTAGRFNADPRISSSNGDGYANVARWCIVYSYRHSSTDYDVHGSVIDAGGVIARSNTVLEFATTNELFRQVSSPAVDWTGGNAVFMVTYERQSTGAAVGMVVDANLNVVVPRTDLTAAFGFLPLWVISESDGCRFAVLHSQAFTTPGPLPTTTFLTNVSTLGVVANRFVLQDPGSSLTVSVLGLPLGADSIQPQIASKRAGGGGRSDYCVAAIARRFQPQRPWVWHYRGHATAGGITRRAIGSGSCTIDIIGSVALGESYSVVLTNPGGPAPGLMFGLPANIPIPFCPGFTLGLTDSTTLSTSIGQLNAGVPCNAAMLGITFTFQGFALAGGTCLGSITLSDAMDITLQ